MDIHLDIQKGLSFISNRQRRKEGTLCASELAGIEPTPPALEEQGMRAFRQLSTLDIQDIRIRGTYPWIRRGSHP
jgi:hypothetical protein